MRGRLLHGQPSLVDEGLHVGVVVGDLEQLSVPHEVGPGVADVHQRQPGARPPERGQRGGGLPLVRRRGDLADRPVGLADRVGERAEQIRGRHGQRFQRFERGHGRRTRQATRTADPVGHGQKSRSRVRGVLVARAHQPQLRAGGVPDPEHGCRLVHRGASSCQVVDEEGGQPPPGGGLGLHLLPVAVDLRGRLGRRQVAYPPDTRQRHAQPSQPGDQPGPLHLRRIVVAVARLTVHRGRPQQPELVVQPQRLRRQPSSTREGSDRQQSPHRRPLLAPATPAGTQEPGASPRGKVNPTPLGVGCGRGPRASPLRSGSGQMLRGA
jgi:hypothetical protein